MVRPIIEFKFDSVLARSNNIFEVMTVEPIDALLKVGGELNQNAEGDEADEEGMGDLMGKRFYRVLERRSEYLSQVQNLRLGCFG